MRGVWRQHGAAATLQKMGALTATRIRVVAAAVLTASGFTGCYLSHAADVAVGDAAAADDSSGPSRWSLGFAGPAVSQILTVTLAGETDFAAIDQQPALDDPWLRRMTDRHFESHVEHGTAMASLVFDLVIAADVTMTFHADTRDGPGLAAAAWVQINEPQLCYAATPGQRVRFTFQCVISRSVTEDGEAIVAGQQHDGCLLDDSGYPDGSIVHERTPTGSVERDADATGVACLQASLYFAGGAGSLAFDPVDAHNAVDATLTVHATVL